MNNFLFEVGSTGSQQFEHMVVAFFRDGCDATEIQQRVSAYFSELRALGFVVPASDFVVAPVESLDWTTIWKRHFKPIYVFDKLVIKPSWEPLPPTRSAVIEIDPKQAFGTGNHATTLLALEFLAGHVERGYTVLDVGTGTGILAMAAIKLGAVRVVAVDIDPVAIDAARENCQRNSLDSEIALMVGETTALPSGKLFDIIVANINRREVMRLFPEFCRLLSTDGLLFVTGILVAELEQVTDQLFRERAFALERKVEKDEWCGLLLKREAER